MQHPRYNLLRHPRPQILQHRLRPLTRTRLQHMFLNAFLSNTREDALVAIDKPENLEFCPYGGVHIRVPLWFYLFLLFVVWFGFGWGEEACTEFFGCNSEGWR